MDKYIDNLKKKYSLSDVKSYLKKYKLNVIVIGEMIIDEYYFGRSVGKSGKAPIVAFENEFLDVYEGGSVAIKNHLKDLCDIDIFTGDFIVKKRRYIEKNQKLFETYSYVPNNNQNKIKFDIKDYDLVIVADFGNRLIDKNLQNKIEKESKYLCLNTQMNAGNMGLNTINKYKRWDYICIDHNELRLATSNQYDTIDEITIDKFKGMENKLISITESTEGSIIYDGNTLINTPSLIDQTKIVDTTGAGDSYFAITSILSYLKVPIDIIGLYGNIAGAISCTYMGNKDCISKDKLFNYLDLIWK